MACENNCPTNGAVGEAYVAVVTPFTLEGKVDEAALHVYLQYLYKSGIRHVVVNGTTGEFWALTLDERRRVAAAARQSWPGKLTVNVSACALQDVLTLLDHCNTRVEDGQRVADAVLLLPPFYYERAGPAGIRAFLEAALAHARLPVLLYNYPRHTGNVIEPHTFRELRARFPMLQGIKNSEMSAAESAAFQEGGCTAVLIGTEDLYGALEQKFDGFVTGGAGSVLPDVVAQLHSAYRAGQQERARKLQRDRMDLWIACMEATKCENIAAIKAALSLLLPGFTRAVRPPLLPADNADMGCIRNFMTEHGMHRS